MDSVSDSELEMVCLIAFMICFYRRSLERQLVTRYRELVGYIISMKGAYKGINLFLFQSHLGPIRTFRSAEGARAE